MRTLESIRARFDRIAQQPLPNFEPEILVGYLPYEHLKHALKPEVTQAEWDATVYPLTEEHVLEAAKTYMEEYGWPKCTGHRGISAGRTLQKMTAWFWLIERDDIVAFLEDDSHYAQYGAPMLKFVCEQMGWPMPDDEGALRMMRGEPCGSHDGCGCGS